MSRLNIISTALSSVRSRRPEWSSSSSRKPRRTSVKRVAKWLRILSCAALSSFSVITGPLLLSSEAAPAAPAAAAADDLLLASARRLAARLAASCAVLGCTGSRALMYSCHWTSRGEPSSPLLLTILLLRGELERTSSGSDILASLAASLSSSVPIVLPLPDASCRNALSW